MTVNSSPPYYQSLNIRFIRLVSATALIGSGLTIGFFSAQAAVANVEIVIHSFLGGANDGLEAESRLIADDAGNFYGTSAGGGTGNDCDGSTQGCGTVYQVTPGGQVTVLYSFAGGSDGYTPRDGLYRDATGNFYGTTADGGASGLGTAFKLAPDGTKTTLHSFAGGTDGSTPNGDLVTDTAGNLYGTTNTGGTGVGSICRTGCGTVFKITPGGQETVLYSFAGAAQGDGALPSGGLLADGRGNFYGATSAGGNAACDAGGCGTIFRITARGREKVLYAFAGGSDGDGPNSNLLLDQAGNLFGTTVAGGIPGHPNGTVFKLSRRGVHTVLHKFGTGTDGASPVDGMVADATGNMYGTTASGGMNFNGTVFMITPAGQETVLHLFQNGADGFAPYASPALDGQGKLYGTTIRGGAMDKGVVYTVEL